MANSLSDMLTSVDWSKLVSSQDAKNALIGSALGGVLLGGAGMMADRDPEESKYAPVSDALLGALLGGVAGYGIPKGLAMFRDAGSLAPDHDRLKTNYLLWGGSGLAAGAGLFGLTSLRKTLQDRAAELRGVAQANLPATVQKAQRELADAEARGAPFKERQGLERTLKMYGSDKDATATLDRLRREAGLELRAGHLGKFWKTYFGEIGKYKRLRNGATRGYATLADLIYQVGEKADASGARPSWTDVFSRFHARRGGNVVSGAVKNVLGAVKDTLMGGNATSASHYHTGPGFFGTVKRVPAWGRMGMRAGKYGIPTAIAAMLLHRWLGPSSSDNIK